MISKITEKGQALVLIALAAVGLFAFAALAIDGSMIFSDRRHAQNAADTAVLQAALTKVRGGDWQTDGWSRASSNGYDNNGATNDVIFYSPPVDGPYQANNEYIQVKIRSDVQLNFARIIGRQTATNYVQAVARVVPTETKPMFDGHAVVGLAPHDCKAIKYQGNANTSVVGSGIFVNSDCASAAFFNNSSSAELTAPCLKAVGGIQANPSAINIPTSCIQSGPPAVLPYNYPPDNMVFPNVTCAAGGSRDGSTLHPGTYSGHFPPSGVTDLSAGYYCVSGEFRVNGGDTLRGNGVLIVMMSGDVVFNGGATVQLNGMPTPQSETNPYGGLLLYMPLSNAGTITLNGNSDSGFTGSILAPAADISIEGTGGSGVHGQIIGYTVDLAGTSDTTIVYEDQKNWDAPVPPQIEMKQ
jgi:hypothetical protein